MRQGKSSNRLLSNRWTVGFCLLLCAIPLFLRALGVQAEAWELTLWGGVLVVVSLVLRPAGRRDSAQGGSLPLQAKGSPATSEGVRSL